MPKFPLRASYSAAGMKGLMKDKAETREKAVAALCKSVGGKLDAMYFVLGDDDVIVIADLPGRAEAAAVCMTVASSGALSAIKTQGLLTMAEMDAALALTPKYRPPGG
jgi:uncharacterized protein with GYD domain